MGILHIFQHLSTFQSLLLAPLGLFFSLLIRAIGAYTDLLTTYLMESTGARIPYHMEPKTEKLRRLELKTKLILSLFINTIFFAFTTSL